MCGTSVFFQILFPLVLERQYSKFVYLPKIVGSEIDDERGPYLL